MPRMPAQPTVWGITRPGGVVPGGRGLSNSQLDLETVYCQPEQQVGAGFLPLDGWENLRPRSRQRHAGCHGQKHPKMGKHSRLLRSSEPGLRSSLTGDALLLNKGLPYPPPTAVVLSV